MAILNISANKRKNFQPPKGGTFKTHNISNLRDLIYTSAKLYGKKTAFLSKREKAGEYFEISYEKFRDDVEALGTTLLDIGLKDEKIAIIGANSYQWVVSYFATACGVGVVVPLDKELKKEEIHNLIKTASCKGVFYSKEYEDVLKDCDIQYKFVMNNYEDERDREIGNSCFAMIEEGYHLLDTGHVDYINRKIDNEKMSAIIFTSGTTGKAKGVMLSHKNIVAVVMGASKIIKLRTEDRALSILPIHHTFESSITIMTGIYQGCSTAFYEGLKYVLKNIQESKASVLIGVPLIVESLYNKIWSQAKKTKKDKLLKGAIKTNTALMAMGIDKRRLIFKSIYDNFGGKIRVVMSGAAALNPSTLRGFKDLGFEVLQGYGLTECAPLIAATPIWENIYRHAGSCGKIMPGGEVRIDAPDSNGIGEICYRGDNVMLGYYNMPNETKKVIKDGWLYTGDLGFLDSEGWLYITGRRKNIIVTKTGKNIYPEELEALINETKYVNEAIVYGVDIKDQDTVVSVQVYPDYELIEEELKFSQDEIGSMIKESIEKINDKLAIYKQIKKIIIREEDFVRTTTKKIKRLENIAQFVEKGE